MTRGLAEYRPPVRNHYTTKIFLHDSLYLLILNRSMEKTNQTIGKRVFSTTLFKKVNRETYKRDLNSEHMLKLQDNFQNNHCHLIFVAS